MTTTMTARDILLDQFGRVYDFAAANVEAMTHEDSLVQPAAGNCANWILSHLVYVHNNVMRMLGDDPVWMNDRLAAPQSAPIVDPEDAIDWNALRDRFLGSRDRCMAAIERASDELLAEMVPGPTGTPVPRAQLLGFLALHQAYHAGQLGLTRRIAGLDGAIRGPAPRKEDAARTRSATA
jgi:uncharacterized damage-inducible protein DinB